MNGKSATWLWLGVLVLFLAGASLVGWKLWQRQKARALMAEHQRWEVSIQLPLQKAVGGEELAKLLEEQNRRLDRYEVLRPVIDDLDLVTFWGLPGPDEAMEKLKEVTEFRAGAEPGVVVFVAGDSDKEMAGKLGGAVWRYYEDMERRERYLLPSLPPPSQ